MMQPKRGTPMKRATFVFALWLFGGCGIAAGPKYGSSSPAPYSTSAAASDVPLAVLVADPQIHNPYGRAIRSASPLADVAAKTALRPPVLNLLAPLALESLVEASRRRAPSAPVLVLGDTLNIACTGEWATFAASMNSATAGTVWLTIHGNHDSFMLGNENRYSRPDESICGRQPRGQGEELPSCDATWCDPNMYALWSPQDCSNFAYNESECGNISEYGWAGVCATPTNDSAPMSKLSWIASYLHHLKSLGAMVPGPELNDSFVGFEANEGTDLNELAFRGALYTAFSTQDHREQWKSFIVQSFINNRVRFVLIDTSVGGAPFGQLRRPASGGLRDLQSGNAAGNNGQVGALQLEAIEYLLSFDQEEAVGTVIVGHVPLHKLHDGDELLDLVSRQRNTVYISAHTHAATSSHTYSRGSNANSATDNHIHEINIGSTTDTPMESSVLSISERSEYHIQHDYLVGSESIIDCPDIRYTSNSNSQITTQACTHLRSARMLSGIAQSRVPPPRWSEATSQQCSQSRSLQAAQEILRRMNELNVLSRQDAALREALLCIAAAASSAHGSTGTSPANDL